MRMSVALCGNSAFRNAQYNRPRPPPSPNSVCAMPLPSSSTLHPPRAWLTSNVILRAPASSEFLSNSMIVSFKEVMIVPDRIWADTSGGKGRMRCSLGFIIEDVLGGSRCREGTCDCNSDSGRSPHPWIWSPGVGCSRHDLSSGCFEGSSGTSDLPRG